MEYQKERRNIPTRDPRFTASATSRIRHAIFRPKQLIVNNLKSTLWYNVPLVKTERAFLGELCFWENSICGFLPALSNDIILAWQFAWILRFPSFEFNGMQDRALQKYSSVFFFFTYTPLLYYFAKRVRHGMTFAVCLRLSLQWYHPFFFQFFFSPIWRETVANHKRFARKPCVGH